ncbi:MAG: hypothetical protein KC505_01580 [Myxococcales bacterium]|nr:hypothetical protein [Myxococcales bacterium]USN50143.1 MAG: hypothetical protein H6731_07685 [Myxococcales bacterium]
MLNPCFQSKAYQKALQKLLERTSNPKLGLERIESLLDAVAYQRNNFKSVQIVGTNGKGSTSAFLASLLLAHGHSVAVFTSPHLSTARERIQINGKMISEEDFIEACDFVLTKADPKGKASFFECILAMFIYVAQKAKVQVIIAEAGLGGRLDATTALKTNALGVSTIGLDHQNILGDSIEAITSEKIAAAHSGQQVVCVEQRPEAWKIIKDQERQRGFNLILSEKIEMPLGLQGRYQKQNAGLALSLMQALALKTEDKKVSKALLEVQWPGRYEKIVHGGVSIIFDGAHNPLGISELVATLKNDKLISVKPLILVFGSLKSANTKEKINLLTAAHTYLNVVVHLSKNPRREEFDRLEEFFIAAQLAPQKIKEFSSWATLIEQAKKNQANILVCGSLYTVGELRGELLKLPCDHLIPKF